MPIVDDNIIKAMRNYRRDYFRLGFFSKISRTFEVIIGTHYREAPMHRDPTTGKLAKCLTNGSCSFWGEKGLLDLTILPLLTRGLVYSELRKKPMNGSFIDPRPFLIEAFIITVECARLSTGFLLTGLLIPLIAFTSILHSSISCMAPNEAPFIRMT